MEAENKKSSRSYRMKFRNWFSKEEQEDKPSYNFFEIQDGVEDEIDEYEGDLSLRSVEFDPCILTNKLRVFVGTWNVAGRSPGGSLAVDLEDWLNLKNAADIYVLGFQEIVPLKTLNVLGAEDQGVATRWNNLIGITLNKKIGSPLLFTPMLNKSSIISSSGGISNYHNHMDNNNNNNYYPIYSHHHQEECTSDHNNNNYMLVASKKMVGVFISVWIKQKIMKKCHVSNVRVCSVACGVLGYLGNKGSVAVSMSVGGTSFCFVAAHLASGEKKGDEGRRNHQVEEIFKRTCFPKTTKEEHDPLTILGHDRIFWFGDLNYRLYLEDNFARHLIRKQDWKALQEFDQLQKELEEGGVFEGWKEGTIEFPPTYKYSSSINNRYCGGNLQSNSGEKQRTPAWCDRILWYGKGVEQLEYIRSESKFSDHRPVSALFSTHIEFTHSSSSSTSTPLLQQFHNIPPKLLHPNPGINNEDEDGKSTLLSLLSKDIKIS